MLSYIVYENDTINVLDTDSLKQGVWKEFWGNGDLKGEVSYKWRSCKRNKLGTRADKLRKPA